MSAATTVDRTNVDRAVEGFKEGLNVTSLLILSGGSREVADATLEGYHIGVTQFLTEDEFYAYKERCAEYILQFMAEVLAMMEA